MKQTYLPALPCLLLTLLFAFAAWVLPVTAEGTPQAPIRVGVFDFEGFYSKDALGNQAGYGYDYLDEIAKSTGFQYEYVYGSWEDCLQWLQDGTIDILDLAQKTPEREAQFLFCGYSTGRSYAMLTVRADNTAIAFNDYAAFEGMRIGLLTGNSCNEKLEDYASIHSFSYVGVAYESTKDLEAALQSGEVDGILSSSLRVVKGEKIVARFAPEPFYMMLQKENVSLQRKIDKALEEIQIYKPDLSIKLEAKYFSSDYSSVVLTRRELDYLNRADTVRVVYDSDWAPFESYDKKEEKPVGLNVDLFHSIADATGLSFEFMHGYNYEQALAAVKSGEADMLLSYDSKPAAAQQHGIRLSDTFLEAPIAIVGRDYTLSQSSSFAISDMHPLVYAYIKERFPHSRILQLPNIEDCYRAVESGKVDFTTENIYAVTSAIKSGAYGDLMIASVTTLKDRMSFAFSDEADFMLINIFNKYIANLTAEEKDRLLLNYSASLSGTEGMDMLFKRYNTEIMTGAIVLLGFVVSCLVLIVLQQKKNRRRLRALAYTDTLTGLPNLNQLHVLMKEILAAQPQAHHLLLQFDINRFTLINELYGFEEGDRVLCAVRDALLHCVGPRDIAVRSNDDKFVLLLTGLTEEEIAHILASAEACFMTQLMKQTSHKLHFSVGRYVIHPGESDVSAALEKVNYAHNTAKRIGLLNTAYHYDDALKQTAIEHREIESKMEDALRKRDFALYLQPKYHLDTRKMIGAEALVRWENYRGDLMLSPLAFIPLFERNGFILNLDMYMFRRSCEFLKQWQASGRPQVSISVNFSRLHLQNENFVEELIEIADSLQTPRSSLEIELTESAALDNEEALVVVIDKLHAAGFSFAMDDFGTGYSSLGLLKNLVVDTLKIDRSFFEKGHASTRARVVLENVIRMAKELGIHTVAEGVETSEHVDLLHTIGCEIVQGYYFARPMSAEDFLMLPLEHHEERAKI